MKKILSLMLMLVVAACMTGCSLHGGHGHGPAAATTTEMTLRTSIPASVFEAPAGNLRGALRAANAENCTVNFGGITLEHEKYDATNKLHFFAKLVQKALVQAMAKSAEKTQIKVQDENNEQVGDIVEVDLPEDFAEASEEQKSEPQTAAVVIKADENGEITGAKTLSIVQLVEVAKKKIEELVEAFVAVEEKAATFAEVVVKENGSDTGKTITKEEAEEKNPVKKDDTTGTEFSVKFYNVSGIQWKYNFDRDSYAWTTYADYCSNQEPAVTPTEEGCLEYWGGSAALFLEANGIQNPTAIVRGAEVTSGSVVKIVDMLPDSETGRAKAIMVETLVDGKPIQFFDGDDENPNDKPTCKYTSLKGTVALVKPNGTTANLTVNSFEDVMEPKQGQDTDVVHKNGIDIVTANGTWFISFKHNVTPGEYTFNVTEATLTSKLKASASDSEFKDYKIKPFSFTVRIQSESELH